MRFCAKRSSEAPPKANIPNSPVSGKGLPVFGRVAGMFWATCFGAGAGVLGRFPLRLGAGGLGQFDLFAGRLNRHDRHPLQLQHLGFVRRFDRLDFLRLRTPSA